MFSIQLLGSTKESSPPDRVGPLRFFWSPCPPTFFLPCFSPHFSPSFSYLCSGAGRYICDLTLEDGIGDKLLLRTMARNCLGLSLQSSNRVKRAIQFGSGSKKVVETDKSEGAIGSRRNRRAAARQRVAHAREEGENERVLSQTTADPCFQVSDRPSQGR